MSGFSGYNTTTLAGACRFCLSETGQIKRICSWKNCTAQARGQFLPKRMCYSRGFHRWEKEKKQLQENGSSTDGKQDWDWPSNVIKKTPKWLIYFFFMTPSCLKSCTLECASSCNFFILFLFPSCNMLVQCTNAGLFPFYQYTCKLLSSKVTSEVLFNCLFIFASSCMVIPSACCCSLHFHTVCQCCFISKLGCKCVWGICPCTSHQQIFVWLVF